MKWNGFKRSYGGPFSQFIQPQTGNKSTRALTPNQQSYSFYYLSKMNNRISALSIGRFITDSGLYNNSEINGLHQDEITTATFFSKSNWNQFNLKFIISQYLENRKWLSEFSTVSRHYLNRGQILGILSTDDDEIVPAFVSHPHVLGLVGELSQGEWARKCFFHFILAEPIAP